MSNLMFAMELMIEERGLLYHVFEQKAFEPEAYSLWLKLVAAQDIYISSFLEFAPGPVREYYESSKKKSSFAELSKNVEQLSGSTLEVVKGVTQTAQGMTEISHSISEVSRASEVPEDELELTPC